MSLASLSDDLTGRLRPLLHDLPELAGRPYIGDYCIIEGNRN